MDGLSSVDLVRFERVIICELLSIVNELDLVYGNAFLLLQVLLECKHGFVVLDIDIHDFPG